MAWINAYSCTTAAGDGVEALWGALREGRTLSSHGLFAGERPGTVRELLAGRLVNAVRQIPAPLGRYGVLLASTKGLSQDFIAEGALPVDPVTPLLDEVLRALELRPERRMCVSNACSSGLAALEIAREWLGQGLDQVLVLAADAVTPFVQKGFASLNLISSSRPRPFSAERDGFFLGEAAAALLLSNREEGFYLYPVGLDTEGFAVARPSHSGESLVRAGRALERLDADVVIAHGTGTAINDATEDLALSVLFPEGTPPVTGSKWCVGHSLASSAALDTILACEILKRGEAFGLVSGADPAFKGRYLSKPLTSSFERVLISSLGFGGMHAMAMVAKDAVSRSRDRNTALSENTSDSTPALKMTLRFDHYHHTYEHPAKQTPEWASRVERWYQLDAAAFGIADLYWRERPEPPRRIYLASPGASNYTDHQFYAQAPSPAKFVHTLPNIRGAALLRLMEWSGRVYCIQNDPRSILTALEEAAHVGEHAWVVSAFPLASGGFQAHIFDITPSGRIQAMANAEGRDKDWLSSLETGLDR